MTVADLEHELDMADLRQRASALRLEAAMRLMAAGFLDAEVWLRRAMFRALPPQQEPAP